MNPSDLLKRGQELLFAACPDFQEAREIFYQVTIAAPEWNEGHFCLAIAYENLDNPSESAKAYRKAIQCDPNDSRPRIGLGRLLSALGHFREAIAELEKGIELKPRYGESDARLFLAAAYEKSGDIFKAVEQWKLVSESKPCYPSYDEPMRQAHEKLKQYEKGN